MVRFVALAGFVVGLLAGGPLLGQQGIQHGKIVKLDPAKGQLTIRTDDGKEHDVAVAEKTRIMGVDGKPVKDRFKSPEFKVDTPVMFKIGRTEGKRAILD